MRFLPQRLRATWPPSPNRRREWEDIRDLRQVRPGRPRLRLFLPPSLTRVYPAGAILPLALGLLITAMLLLMIGCRLRLVRHKLKKARPLNTEESDYLINGMYL